LPNATACTGREIRATSGDHGSSQQQRGNTFTQHQRAGLCLKRHDRRAAGEPIRRTHVARFDRHRARSSFLWRSRQSGCPRVQWNAQDRDEAKSAIGVFQGFAGFGHAQSPPKGLFHRRRRPKTAARRSTFPPRRGGVSRGHLRRPLLIAAITARTDVGRRPGGAHLEIEHGFVHRVKRSRNVAPAEGTRFFLLGSLIQCRICCGYMGGQFRSG